MDTAHLSTATVLVVDDVRFNRDIVRQLLRGLGHPTMIEASDGNEALRAFSEGAQPIDFVISDFDMPNCHGLQLLKAVRTGRHGAARATPFAMLTSYSDVHLVRAALSLDVSAFLIRPVSKAKMIDGFERMFAKQNTTHWLRPAGDYDAIDVSPARIAEWKILPTDKQRLKALEAMLPDTPLARRLSAAMSDLMSNSGESVASQIAASLDAFVGRGAIGVDDLPRVMGDVRRDGRMALKADQQRLAKALQEIREGAPLVADMHTADGKLFIAAGTELTPQILNIVINLDDLGLLKNVDDTLAKSAGVRVPEQPRGPAMQCAVGDLSLGMMIARDLKTADGRRFLIEGSILDEKMISQINIASELGQIGGTVWVRR